MPITLLNTNGVGNFTLTNNNDEGSFKLSISNNIITDNLLLYIDANNSISYPGSGTTWFDLTSPSNDVTLYNSPTFTSGTPSYFTFNGSNQYGNSTGNVVPSLAYSKCVWFYLNSYATNNNLVSSLAGGHFMYLAATNKLYCGHANWGNYQAYPSITTFNLNTWYFVVLTFDTTNGMTLYVNDTLDSTYTTDKTQHGGDGSTEIASFAGGNLLTGRISEAMTYGKALSQAEVIQNYNATKVKYGL